MKNKVVALILIIPIVLMLCVFSAANIATLKVPIAVSGVDIFHDMQETINLAEGNQFQIHAQVMPRNASNDGLIYSYEAVQGFALPNITIDSNGLVSASGYGVAKITVITKDGAYKKSFLIEVTSTLASGLDISINKTTDIVVGDEFTVSANVHPNEALDKNVKFYSSNSNIIQINELSGKATAISSGTVTLTAKLTNGLNGELKEELNVIVFPSLSSSLISFNGKQTLTDEIFSDKFSTLMEVNFTSLHELGISLTKEDIIFEYDQTKVSKVELTEIENNNGIYKYNLNIEGINDEEFTLKAKLNFDNVSEYYSEIILEKIVDINDLKINLINFPNYIKKGGMPYEFEIEILPADFTEYSLNVYFSNNNVALNRVNNKCTILGTNVGKDILNVELIVDDTVIPYTQNIEVFNPPTSIAFADSIVDYGIENIYTIANKKIENGKLQDITHTFGFTIDDIDLNYIEFKSSNENIAKFENGELVIKGEGKVKIQAIELQSKYFGIDLKTPELEIRCVEGIEINDETSFEDIVKATKLDMQIVLGSNIMLGKELLNIDKTTGKVTRVVNSDSECASILRSQVEQIKTSYDWNYYKNNPKYNMQEAPLINYILKFTKNVYGNGFSLNASNITNFMYATKLKSIAVFTGPLDLVAIPDASVKAQDNICFILTDEVTLNNIELIGTDLVGGESSDLNQLNYSGTVVEVMGDKVKIVNSRIRNGRNCVRVYGKESGNLEKINVLIESCILSNAREFIVKMGTNKKEYGNFTQRDTFDLSNETIPENIWEECAPKIGEFNHLNDETLSEDAYNALVEEYLNNQNFLDLVNTNLTIKNCVLHTSGLFSIGLECSFAGPALDGGHYGKNWNFKEYGWSGIAGTSYPTMLNLEGTVKLYDWKNISNIDSSTLIEGNLFDFDISSMIENLYDKGTITDIIAEDDNVRYCHGGIVMYGGGKNYCLVNNNIDNKQDVLSNYTLDLDDVGTMLTKMLKRASGKEAFRIFVHNKRDSALTHYQQELDFQNQQTTFLDLIKTYSF